MVASVSGGVCGICRLGFDCCGFVVGDVSSNLTGFLFDFGGVGGVFLGAVVALLVVFSSLMTVCV